MLPTSATTSRRVPRPSIPDVVADAIAVLHTVSNAELHALATEHLGRAPREDEFEPSTWVMVREGFHTTGVAYAARSRRARPDPSFRRGDGGPRRAAGADAADPAAALRAARPARGTTRAFFDVEFATTGWTTLANVTGWAAISLPLGDSVGQACRSACS